MAFTIIAAVIATSNPSCCPWVLRPAHQGRTLSWEASTAGIDGHKINKVLGEQAASGSPFHHAAGREALQVKLPSEDTGQDDLC